MTGSDCLSRVTSTSPFVQITAVYDTSVAINAFGGRYFDPAAGRTVYTGVDLLTIRK